MDNGFEEFLQQHQDHFEKGSPPQRVWDKLKTGLEDHHRRRARVVRMRRISWGIAAGMLLCIGITVIIFKGKGPEDHNNVAGQATHQDTLLDEKKIMAQKMEQDSAGRIAGVTDYKTRQSLYNYTRLIETRQKQMAALRQIDPELYVKSQKALVDLGEVYNRLKKQLPQSVDQQKILQGLIHNLQMQEQILTNQLQLLQSMQQPDKSKNEKHVKEI